MKFQRLLAVLVCTALLSFSTFATPGSLAAQAQKQKEQKLDKEVEKKALAMLDELIEEASTFRLPENRVRIMAMAADILWQYDEKRARTLFAEAMNLLAQTIRQPEDTPEALPENYKWQLFQLRQETAQMIASRDAQLASEFLAATRPVDNKSGAYNPVNEAQLELMLAQQIARQDPKKALQAAKEKLATAKNPGVVSGLLSELRQKDPAAAQELADAIVARLRADSQLGPESAISAIGLLSYAPHPNNNAESQGQYRAVADQTKYLIAPAVARELIEKVAAAALAALATARKQNDSEPRNNAINLLQQIKSMMPYIEKYAPASVAALKRGFTESEQLMDPGQRRWNDLNALAEKGSSELLLEAAAKASPEMKVNYYQRAVQIAREKEGAERARQLVSEHFPEGQQRQQALREIEQQTMWQSINTGKFDEARRSMATLRNVQERVNMLMQMAAVASNAGRKEESAQFLNEAWGLVEGPAESNQQLNAQLQLAGAFIASNPSRSFDIIEATLDRFNELFAASAFLESFDQQGSFRDKEMVLNNGGGGRASQYIWQYVQHLGELSRTDLERVQALIGRFARVEVRANIRLGVLHRLLRGSEGNWRGGFGVGGRRHLSLLNIH
jgi:hypothetical protein